MSATVLTESSPLLGESASDDEPPNQSRRTGGTGGAGLLNVELRLHTRDTTPTLVGWLERRFKRIAKLAGVTTSAAITLVAVDDAEMTRLHKQYQNIASTTDVLTFDLRDQPGDPLEADIVLCVDEAIRQAAKRSHDVRLELLLYAVHGLLHLLGFDDHDSAKARLMHQREDQLLQAVGLGAVYDSRPNDRKSST